MPQPASTCPHCLQEGEPHWIQFKRAGRGYCSKPLVNAVRFICPDGHIWNTDLDQALLHGQFLARQLTP